MDDFEDTLINWDQVSIGGGSAITLSAARSWTDCQSLKLVTPNISGTETSVLKALHEPSHTRIAAECRMFATSDDLRLNLILNAYDGALGHTARLRWDVAANTVAYMNDAPAWVTISDQIDNMQASEGWIPFKVVMDFNNYEYIRAWVSNIEIDLSNLGLNTFVSGNTIRMEVALTAETTVNANRTAYFDNVIITQGEP